MLKLIRNGRLYAPDEMGKRDILIAAGKIIKIINSQPDIQYFDATLIIVVQFCLSGLAFQAGHLSLNF